MVTKYPSVTLVTDTEAITVSLLPPVSAYAAKTSLELVCKGIAQGDWVQINSCVLTNPRMLIVTVRGKEVNAVKTTYGWATVPVGAWMNAYKLEDGPPGGVGRKFSGNPVEVEDGNGAGACESVCVGD